MAELATIIAAIALLAVWTTLGQSNSAKAELRYLRRRVEVLEDQVSALRHYPADAAPPLEPEPEPEFEPEVDPEPEPEPRPPLRQTPPAPTRRAFEQVLTENWLVWLGGLTLALGGAFLVKYSFDQGWLGPGVRVILGVLLGGGLVAGGHVLAKRHPTLSFGGVDPSAVPPALVGAGTATAFASLYAAFALYGLIPPLLAFVLLAGVAVATVLLALTHGPYVALLGLIGGHAVPLLIRTGSNDAVALFGYLLLLNAGVMLLLRWKQWWRLAWVSLVASAGWVLLWLGSVHAQGDEVPLGLFMIALLVLTVILRRGIRPVAWLADRVDSPEVAALVWAAGGGAAAVLLLLVLASEHAPAALALAFAYGALTLGIARLEPEFDRLPAAAALLALLTLASWELPDLAQAPDLLRPLLPERATGFAATAALFAVLFSGGGFAALWGAARPGRWATLSAAVPVLVYAAVYWRLSLAGVDLAWAAGALGIAALLLAAAERTARWRHHPGLEAALAAYAVGVLAALALAAAIALEQAWLTVTLAALLPGIAWVEGHLRVQGLRRAALILAAVVLVRLALNPYVLDYPLSAPVFNWLLYGYGLPLLAFATAAHLFRRTADDRLVQVLEAGTVLFLVLLVSLEIRHLMAGSLEARRYGLAEQAVHSLAWLSIAAGLTLRKRVVPLWAGRLLIGLATVQILLLQGLDANPLLTNRPVGDWPVVNLLLLAYGLPAVLYAVLFRQTSPPLRRLCGGMALLLAFIWLTLEVRHAFTGSRLGRLPVSDAELYAYSAAWLAYAGALLAAGLRWRSAALRHAGLAMLLLEVLKVFLVDMNGLTGLWRALSFLGLGAALVGVGYLYRRFVRRPDQASGKPGSPPSAGTG